MISNNYDYLWKVRCPESGYLVGECGCTYCFDEFELDAVYDELYDNDDVLPYADEDEDEDDESRSL